MAMVKKRVWLAALAALLCAAFSGMGSYAYAAETGSVSAGSWQLGYEVNGDGTATITGVTKAGSSALEIPSTANGHEVVEMSPSAFLGASVTEVTIPASMKAVSKNCFTACTSLKKVTFKGSSLGFIGDAAFSGCTSLQRIEIPELTSKVVDGNAIRAYSIGTRCFYGCSSLVTVVLKGDANTDSKGYFANSECFLDCDKLENLVYFCKKSDIVKQASIVDTVNDAKLYLTMTFYGSQDDADNCVRPLYSITCLSTTKMRDIMNGAVPSSSIWPGSETGSRSALSGKVWGVEDHAMQFESSSLSDSYRAVPVSGDDLTYGWVTSPVIDEYLSNPPSQGVFSKTYPTFMLDDSEGSPSVVGFDELAVYGPDGKALAAGTYTLEYRKETTERINYENVTTYTNVDYPSEVGVFQVRAGKDSKYTAWVPFSLVLYSPTISAYSDDDLMTRLARACQAQASMVRGKAKSAVVVPVSDWRYQLIGAGLAGVGDGMLIFDDKGVYNADMVTAFAESKASGIEVVGSKGVIPESASASSEAYLLDYLYERSAVHDKTRYANDETVQGLADEVYTKIKRLHERGNAVYGDGWGSVAIVASPDLNVDTQVIAQYAYANKAPLFFVGSNGLLSSTDLGYLSDGFTRIIIAGDSSYVKDSCLSAIKSATGIEPTRMLATGSDSLGACLGDWESMASGSSTVVVATTENDANITAAGVLAATKGTAALVCSGSADSKRIQDHLQLLLGSQGRASVGVVYLVGALSQVDAGLSERIAKLWSNPLSTAVGAGDTVEVGDYVYEMTSASKAKLVRLRNRAVTSATVSTVSYGASSHSVTAVADNAFAGSGKLKSVTLASSVTKVGASAFKGCTALTSVKAPKATSIGASAFSGCAKLGSISAPAVKTIGANAFLKCKSLKSFASTKATSVGNSAFNGCVKLASVTLTSTGLSRIGAKAFYGCKKLAALKFKTKKLSSKNVGANAFKGMPSSVKVSVPSAKVASYRTLFRSKGLPSKASVKAA